MTSEPPGDRGERRLLVLAPVGKDAALIAATLAKDAVPCVACRDLEHLARELERGGAAVLLTEEVLAEDNGRLATLVVRQPAWSDLPVLLLTHSGADSPIADQALKTLGNVTLLERPVRIAALVSAVRSALRARERQYQARAHLDEREEADQRKNHFLATLAHELRNPLAPIRNSLELLRRAGTSPTAAPVYEIMDRQVNQMVRLIDDLMDVSRITRGKIDLRRATVDLAAVIAAAVETSRPLIDGAKHELTVSLPAEGLLLDADAMRLAQVFANLLNNAAKYTDPGGRISIAARRDRDDALVTVSDTGVGIPAESLSRVFEMFAQADPRDGHARTGLGIGLTLARSLVEMHGGSVTAASEGEGKGSVFAVRLPLDRGASAHPYSSTAVAPRLRNRLRILVVDDNRDAADTLFNLLQMMGAEARVAYDGAAALEATRIFQPSVVMLDLGMPGMDGCEVARRIRAQPGAGDTTLIAVTGWGHASDRQRTQQAGFHSHMVKPVDISAMQAVLATLRG
jgi:signal transduction histidine kinase